MVDDIEVKPVAQRAQEMIDANEELVAFVQSCSDAQWACVCEGETWPVAVVAYHVAAGHRVVSEWIGQLLAGGVSLPVASRSLATSWTPPMRRWPRSTRA